MVTVGVLVSGIQTIVMAFPIIRLTLNVLFLYKIVSPILTSILDGVSISPILIPSIEAN